MRLLIVLVLTGLALGAAGAAQASEAGDRCAGLKTFRLPHLEVEDARIVAAGPAGASQLPEHCLFQAVISRRTSKAGQRLGVGFELRLPTDWNGRFVFEGGGGLDGS